MILKPLTCALVVAFSSLSGILYAAETAKPAAAASLANLRFDDPYVLVQDTTQSVLALVKSTQAATNKDLTQFNAQVTQVMDKVVDFDTFARGVMGVYGSKKNYDQLKTDAEKTAFTQRLNRFSALFKADLINTYAKGLLRFNGERIETLPPAKGDEVSSGAVAVRQSIYGANDKVYSVQYSLRKNAQGEWKIQNVIVEGINMGQTYRSQFAEAAERFNGDLDKVMADWKSEVAADKNPSNKATP